MIKHTPYIIQYDNVIDGEKLDYYTKFFVDYFKEKDADVIRDSLRNNEGYLIPSRPYICDNHEMSPIAEEIDLLSYKMLMQYYKDCPLARKYWGPLKTLGGRNIFRTYGLNDFYEWHCDQGPSFKFLTSFLLYLNDDFEGGETMFLNDRLKVKPKKGSVLMFPCGPYFIHKSSRIKSGNKHVVWNCFRDRY